MIKFDTKTHTYTNEYGDKYISVTQLLSKMFPFDRITIAKKVVKYEGSKYYGWKVKDVLSAWRNAANQGTKVHTAVEHYIKENIFPEDPNLLPIVEKFGRLNFRGELLSEVKVWDDDLLIAGTVDLLENCNDHFWLWDIKSSAHIDDEKHLKFSMQLEIYKRLVEKTLNKKTNLGGIIWLKDFVEKQDETIIEVKKVINCVSSVNDLLTERRNEVITLHNNRN